MKRLFIFLFVFSFSLFSMGDNKSDLNKQQAIKKVVDSNPYELFDDLSESIQKKTSQNLLNFGDECFKNNNFYQGVLSVRMAADRGNACGIYQWALLCLENESENKFNDAADWLKILARNKHPLSQYRLALMMHKGQISYVQDEMLKLFNDVINNRDLKGNDNPLRIQAKSLLGYYYLDDKSKKEQAKKFLQQASDLGDKPALYNLAFLLRMGSKQEKEKALNIFNQMYGAQNSTSKERELGIQGLIDLALKRDFFQASCELIKLMCQGEAFESKLKGRILAKVVKRLTVQEWEIFVSSGLYDLFLKPAKNCQAEFGFYLSKILYESRDIVKKNKAKKRNLAIKHLIQIKDYLKARWYLAFIYLSENKYREAFKILTSLFDDYEKETLVDISSDDELKKYVDQSVNVLKELEASQKNNSELAYVFSKMYKIGVLKDESCNKKQKEYLNVASKSGNLKAKYDCAIFLMEEANLNENKKIEYLNKATGYFYEIMEKENNKSDFFKKACECLNSLCDQKHIQSLLNRAYFYFKDNRQSEEGLEYLIDATIEIQKKRDIKDLYFFLNFGCKEKLMDIVAHGDDLQKKAALIRLGDLYFLLYSLEKDTKALVSYENLLLARKYYEEVRSLGFFDVASVLSNICLNCGRFENLQGMYDKAIESFISSFDVDNKSLSKYELGNLFLDKKCMPKIINEKQLAKIQEILVSISEKFNDDKNFFYKVFDLFKEYTKDFSDEIVNPILQSWLEIAVLKKSYQACYVLAEAYKEGKFGYEQNDDLAKKNFVNAFECGSKKALLGLQEMYESRQELMLEENVFVEKAKNNDLMACLFLGALHLNNLIESASFQVGCSWVEKGLFLQEKAEGFESASYMVKSHIIRELNSVAQTKKDKSKVNKEVIYARYLLGLYMFNNGKVKSDLLEKLKFYEPGNTYFKSVINNKSLIANDQYFKTIEILIKTDLDKFKLSRNIYLLNSVHERFTELSKHLEENNLEEHYGALFKTLFFKILNKMEKVINFVTDNSLQDHIREFINKTKLEFNSEN